MYVGQVMTRRVHTTTKDENVEDAFRLMLKKKIAHLPVVEKGALAGIISDRDIRKTFFSKKAHPTKVFPDINVGDIMTAEVVTADPRMSVMDSVNLMLRHGIGCLPIVENKKLKGIVTKDDLLGVFVELLRVIQSSSTIDVELRDEIDDVEAVFSVLRKRKAKVLSYSATPRGKNSHQVCHFRLRLCPVKPIVADLEKKGVKVLEAYGDD